MAKLNFPAPTQGKLHTFAVRELRRVLTLVADVAENDPLFKDTVSAHLAVYNTAAEGWNRPLTGVRVDGLGEVVIGAKIGLTASPVPNDAILGEVSWKSSDTAIATVAQTGEVTGVKAGTVTITAEASGFSGTHQVVVKSPALTGITITGASSVEAAKTTKLTAAPVPAAAPLGTVTWSSSATAVATVAADGTVTGVAAGNAVITAKSGSITKTHAIEVTAAPAG